MGAITRQDVSKEFKIRRYSIQAAALQEVLSFVNRQEIDDPHEALELLLDLLDQEPCNLSPQGFFSSSILMKLGSFSVILIEFFGGICQ